MFYKTSHSTDASNEFKEGNYLKSKVKKGIRNGTYVLKCRTGPRGVNATKVDTLIEKHKTLVSPARLEFFRNLVKINELDDMVVSRPRKVSNP